MRKAFIAILFCVATSVSAQDVFNKSLQQEIESLREAVQDIQKESVSFKRRLNLTNSENATLKLAVDSLNSDLNIAKVKLDSLQKQTEVNFNTLGQTKVELGDKIQETGKQSNERISAVDKSLSSSSIYGLASIVALIAISGTLYGFLFRRQSSDKSSLLEKLDKASSDILVQINETRSNIEESLVKEFGKQTGLMDAQLQVLEQQHKQKELSPVVVNIEPDHSLALKVASEINLIERNVSLMDPKVKGLKQLLSSVRKLKDNLAANGYEMPGLLGKKFNAGMRVIVVNSIPDENLEKDEEIITKVLIPQVNYNDKMIQTAQLEISVGY